MQKDKNIQDKLLSALQEEGVPVTVFVLNGFQLRGQITGSDRYVVVVQAGEEQHIMYKHAISTIHLERPINL